MKRIAYITTALLMLTAGLAIGQQPKSAKEAFAWWFDHDCGIGQEEGIKAFTDFSVELSQMFMTAYEKGPDAGWVDKIVGAEMRMVRANVEYVKKSNGEVAGLTKEQIEAYNSMDLAAYEQSFRATVMEGYKMTALNGLAATKSEAGRAYIGKIAADKRNPNASTANALLQKMGK